MKLTPFKARTLAAALLLLLPTSAFAIDYSIEQGSAAFLIVTKKEGVASGFAHDHLIAAHQFSAMIQAPEGKPEAGSFKLTTQAKNLVVDAPEDQKKHFPRLQELGVQKTAFSALSESDRAEIRKNMLAEGQLNASEFPAIEAQVVSLARKPLSFQGRAFTHTAEVRITVKGKAVTKKLPANVSVSGKELKVEVVGPYTFSEFGISPYSAMLGAVRNADGFHLYVSFTALAP